MYTLRTRLKNGIIAEFLPPLRKTKLHKVIVLCDGAPGVPSKKSLLEFYAKKGFWVFHPRYRGSWESEGSFLEHSPHLDIISLIDALPKGFKDLWNNTTYKFQPDKIFIVGSSFGGAASLLVSADKRVNKVLAFAPLVNWQKPGPDEPIHKLAKFMKSAFGQGYRMEKDVWQKLRSGKFYNPIREANHLPGEKITIVHAKDDTICTYEQTKIFAERSGSKLITMRTGGHLGTSTLLKPRIQKLFQQLTK